MEETGMAGRRKKSSSPKPARSESVLPPATENDVRVRVFEGHTHIVWRVVMPADGGFAVTCSENGTVRRWAPGAGRVEDEPIFKREPFTGLAITADGSRAGVGGRKGTIELIDLSRDRVLRGWHHLKGGVAEQREAFLGASSAQRTSSFLTAASDRLLVPAAHDRFAEVPPATVVFAS